MLFLLFNIRGRGVLIAHTPLNAYYMALLPRKVDVVKVDAYISHCLDS